ncbi:hypothetical protein CMEL01_16459 [Colletotrichum melonis]|uniref:Uncharacterized protein n=1 Tax=Colletotrichum melonis TaxID=1209925 RepID=A0AAI9UDL5_9PEZI|nr:hypothetical protein CMEL01_16459 [Colletotrichum melonis]
MGRSEHLTARSFTAGIPPHNSVSESSVDRFRPCQPVHSLDRKTGLNVHPRGAPRGEGVGGHWGFSESTHHHSLSSLESLLASQHQQPPRETWSGLDKSGHHRPIGPRCLRCLSSLTPTRTTRWSETMLTAPFTRGYVSDLADVALSFRRRFQRSQTPNRLLLN